MSELNKFLKKLEEKSNLSGSIKISNGKELILLPKYKEYMVDFIKNDKKDDVKEQWYCNYTLTNTFMAYDKIGYENAKLLYNAQGLIEYKRVDKSSELVGNKKTELIVFKKRGDYNCGAQCPMSLSLGYMPADDEMVMLHIIF